MFAELTRPCLDELQLLVADGHDIANMAVLHRGGSHDFRAEVGPRYYNEAGGSNGTFTNEVDVVISQALVVAWGRVKEPLWLLVYNASPGQEVVSCACEHGTPRCVNIAAVAAGQKEEIEQFDLLLHTLLQGHGVNHPFRSFDYSGMPLPQCRLWLLKIATAE